MNYSDNIIKKEIDIRKLFKVLRKRKLIVIIGILMITILGVVYAFFKTPIYEARALIEIGNYKLEVNNSNNSNNSNNTVSNYTKASLDNSSQLEKRLRILFIDILKNEQNRVSWIETISIPKGSTEFIEIKSEAISNKLAKEEIEKVLLYIQKEHKKTLDDVKQNREIQIKTIDSKINDVKTKTVPLLESKIKLQKEILQSYNTDIKEIKDNLLKIEKINPSLSALKLMEKRDLTNITMDLNLEILDMIAKKDELLTNEIPSLYDEKIKVQTLMLPHNYKNSEIIGKIITNDYPTKPRKKLIVVVSFIIGVILSVLLVFLLEIILINKKDE